LEDCHATPIARASTVGIAIVIFSGIMGYARAESATDLGIVLPISPVILDTHGKQLNNTIIAGRQVILSANFINDSDKVRPSVAIIEVRNSTGIAVYVTWQVSELRPHSSSQVGVSWLPAKTGNYEIKVFHIPTLDKPGMIFGAGKSEVTVIGEQQ
jgi:hypothetical protein